MTRHLTGYVTVLGPDRRRTTFGPGDEVPAWAAEKITNPAAWTGQDNDGSTPPPSAPKTETPDPPAGDEPPPMHGKGSGLAAWKAYAVAHDVPHDEDAGRDELIDACRAAGVPVE